MAEMFSDIERSPTWQASPLMPVNPPSSQPPQTEFQPPPPQNFNQPAPFNVSNNSSSMRPPVQPGWFPLQEAGGSDQHMNHRSHDLYATEPPRHPNALQWGTGDASPYDGRGGRQPDPAHGFSSPMYAHGYHTPVHDMSGSTGFGWQDARPIPPPPIHTTGLEHLRQMNLTPGGYDDMHRVHQAAQGMQAMMGPVPRYPGMHVYGPPPRKKNQREISVGRWTTDEHRVFLKGLEMYQGPAWGEIARMIGTRTSTQVRTHAQKFFTKLARTNQMLPYFESQIQKERTRLISQGAVVASQSTVTPTSTTAQNFTFNTLSPPRKRDFTGPRAPQSSFDDHSHTLRPTTSASAFLSSEHSTSPLDLYKSRLDITGNSPELAGIRKPRLSNLEYATLGDHATSPYSEPHTPMMGYSTSDNYRDPPAYTPTVGAVQGDWSEVTNRSWPPQPQASPVFEQAPPQPTDPDSLPSVTRLLYRGISG